MFAYDYDGRHCIRVNGAVDIKLALYKEMKRLGVKIYDGHGHQPVYRRRRGGRTGHRSHRSPHPDGEFYIFKAKATILSTAVPVGLWIFSTELNVPRRMPIRITPERGPPWPGRAEPT